MKFRVDTAGFITGIRFYKAAANVGPHTATLWTGTGQLLATGTFGTESTAGWQQLTFSSPVAIVAGTTYVASYHTASGHYSVTTGAFAGVGVDNGPLHALADGVDGPNGVYLYGTGGFPTVELRRQQLLGRADLQPDRLVNRSGPAGRFTNPNQAAGARPSRSR